MFNRHLIINNNGKEYLYLYINNYFEFSNELDKRVSNRRTIEEMVKEYIIIHNLKFNGIKVFLVVGGIVISNIILTNILPQDNYWNDDSTPKIEKINIIDNISIVDNNDNSEIINSLIDNEVNLELPF